MSNVKMNWIFGLMFFKSCSNLGSDFMHLLNKRILITLISRSINAGTKKKNIHYMLISSGKLFFLCSVQTDLFQFCVECID